MCAQDWIHYGYELDPSQESQIFGCDLWIEVTGISRYSDYVCGNGVLDPGEECEADPDCGPIEFCDQMTCTCVPL